MIINDESFKRIENLICEGIVCKNRATEGKKQFVGNALSILCKIYEDNKAAIPDWIRTQMNTFVISSEVKTAEDDTSYYNSSWENCLQLLQDLRSTYFAQKQLDESKKQTSEAEKQTSESQKQTEEAKKSNNTAVKALIISICAVVVSIFAICISQCTRTICIDNTQYDELKTILQDSIVKNNN